MTVPNPINVALLELSRFWIWDGDLMRCRECNRALVASRDGEPLSHDATCRFKRHAHPWRDMRAALSMHEVQS